MKNEEDCGKISSTRRVVCLSSCLSLSSKPTNGFPFLNPNLSFPNNNININIPTIIMPLSFISTTVFFFSFSQPLPIFQIHLSFTLPSILPLSTGTYPFLHCFQFLSIDERFYFYTICFLPVFLVYSLFWVMPFLVDPIIVFELLFCLWGYLSFAYFGCFRLSKNNHPQFLSIVEYLIFKIVAVFCFLVFS